MNGQHVWRDAFAGHGVDQRQKGFVAGFLVVEEHIPHAAAGAGQDQLCGFDAVHQAQPEKRDFSCDAVDYEIGRASCRERV